MKNNRTRERFEVSITARLYGTSSHHEIRISDLSESGCYVDSIAEVSVGESLLIRILVAEGEWLELESVVAHISRGMGFGARFVRLDDHLQASILSLIHRANPNIQQDPKGSWRLGNIEASDHEVDNRDNSLSAMENPLNSHLIINHQKSRWIH